MMLKRELCLPGNTLVGGCGEGPVYENRVGYCYKCELLAVLYEQVPETPRNYYVMTELFMLLHGSDVCETERRNEDE